jgi:hypothetical protein
VYETDVDCGGPSCNPCAVGQKCEANSDCKVLCGTRQVCISGLPPTHLPTQKPPTPLPTPSPTPDDEACASLLHAQCPDMPGMGGKCVACARKHEDRLWLDCSKQQQIRLCFHDAHRTVMTCDRAFEKVCKNAKGAVCTKCVADYQHTLEGFGCDLDTLRQGRCF